MNNTRNNTRNQQTYGSQYGNRSQHGNRSQKDYLKSQLESERRGLKRRLTTIDCKIDALGEKCHLLAAAQHQHQQAIPFAIAQVALSTLGLHFLPPVARTWYNKNQEYLRVKELLRVEALSLWTERNALTLQIQQIDDEIDILQFHP